MIPLVAPPVALPRASSMTSVLFLNRVFPPETGATGHCLAEAAERVARAGFRVRVVADGAGPTARVPGVEVTRTGAGFPADGRPRVRDYGASLIRLFLAAARGPRCDAVVSMTDPPLLGAVGATLAGMWGSSSVHWCQDVHPRLTRLLGRRPPRGVDAFADFAARRHDRVIAIDPDMERLLEEEVGVRRERLRLIPNWPDPGIRPHPPGAGRLRAELGLEGRFIVLLAGNLGLTHPIEAILDAARRLSDIAPDVVFVVAGGGRRRAEMESAARSEGLVGIRFLPWTAEERLSELAALGDVHLVLMHPRATGLMLPRKLTAAAAAARPALLVGPRKAHAARILSTRETGAAVDDGAALAAEILRRRNDYDLRIEEGRRAAIVASAWTVDDAARSLIRTLNEVLEVGH